MYGFHVINLGAVNAGECCRTSVEPSIRSGWWFGTFFMFPYIMGIRIPTDFHIFQRGRSTTSQIAAEQLLTRCSNDLEFGQAKKADLGRRVPWFFIPVGDQDTLPNSIT